MYYFIPWRNPRNHGGLKDSVGFGQPPSFILVLSTCPQDGLCKHKMWVNPVGQRNIFWHTWQGLQDDIYVSETLRKPEMKQSLPSIANSEFLCNSVLALVSPELYKIGLDAVNRLKHSVVHSMGHPNMSLWPSVYSRIQIIVNRETPAHRDPGAAPPAYDMLVSTGTHTVSDFYLADIKTTLLYAPGTVVALCGRVLRHEVMTWEGGERICIAHYMKDNVHERLMLPRPGWVHRDKYCGMMEQSFHERCCNH
jgi:hypothetical protein